MFSLLVFFLSFAVLLLGANYLVNYSVKLAQKLRISPLIVGATAVAIGTSVPEIVIAVNSSLSGRGGLATANIVGANITNIGLILGLAFLFGQIRVGTKKTQTLALLMLLTGSLFATGLIVFGDISKTLATLLLILAAGVFGWEIYAGEKGSKTEDSYLFTKKNSHESPAPVIFLLVALSFLAVYFGGQILVQSVFKLAETLDIQIVVLGLTAVSLGTTLPELTTTLMAVFKNEGKLILGNILGSVIYNFLLVGGLGGTISFLPQVPLFSLVTMMLAISCLTILIHFYQGKIIPRFFGGLLLLGYLLFILITF